LKRTAVGFSFFVDVRKEVSGKSAIHGWFLGLDSDWDKELEGIRDL